MLFNINYRRVLSGLMWFNDILAVILVYSESPWKIPTAVFYKYYTTICGVPECVVK